MKRLRTMAELRSAPLPSSETLRTLAESLADFSASAIDRACVALESTEPPPYVPRWPSLEALKDACRKAAQASVATSPYCGRCRYGRIRLGAEVVRCQCVCAHCDGLGVVLVKANGEPWDMRTDAGTPRFGRVCECRRAA